MLYNSPELAIDFGPPTTKALTLIFFFRGKFSERTSKEAAKVWSTVFEEDQKQQYHIVWDCTEMKGFEINARKQWYELLSKYRPQIAHVTTICSSIMIRSAAKVMLQLYNIPNKVLSPVHP